MTENPSSGNVQTKVYDLVVSLGTDHHHFDRLIQWVDAYLADHPEVIALVQHGFTAPPQHADAVERLPRADLLDLYRAAKVVLVQGGPGSILDAREVGAIPLAVPRVAERDEVVDNHQVEFSRVMETHGEAIVVTSPEDLRNKLDAAFADPGSLRGTYRVPGSDQAADNLSAELEALGTAYNSGFIRRTAQILAGFRSQ
ncbi:glycosyltransferase [Rothia nasimurium]|uniref:glycosyltransferase n=1 Tax=Rothia nasimurium TaxID=85336 RepID=UPI001F38A79F|nr:glycosyltransferase [Rothia nasimurium]